MSSLGDSVESLEPQLLTLGEAAAVLRIGRSLGYQLAHEYLNSGGTSGLPVVRLCDAEAPVGGACDAH
jgi:hypothetical protein